MEKEAFLQMIKSFGLELEESHRDELFSYINKILPQLKQMIEELNLENLEPFIPLKISKGLE
jgi:uncharacterized protein YwgA